MAPGTLKSDEREAVSTVAVPLAQVEVAPEELAPELVQRLAQTHEAADSTLNEDPRIVEAVSRLHPLLREALNHDLARSDLSIRTAPKEGFSRQADLLHFIDNLNEKLEDLWQTQVERKKGYLSGRAGTDLMNLVTTEGPLLSEGGMEKRISAALKIFAMTKIRDAAKAPSSEPFNPEEFERERVLHEIMECLLKGPNRGR